MYLVISDRADQDGTKSPMSNRKVLAIVKDANVLATTITKLGRIIERSEDKKRREKEENVERTGRTKESELFHEYLESRTPAMEYLFVDAGFISLNEEQRRETKNPARRITGFLKGLSQWGICQALRFMSPFD